MRTPAPTSVFERPERFPGSSQLIESRASSTLDENQLYRQLWGEVSLLNGLEPARLVPRPIKTFDDVRVTMENWIDHTGPYEL